MDLDYFFKQYLFNRKPPVFEYFQDDSTFHFKWSGVHENFTMPIDILINKEQSRIHPTLHFQTNKIAKHSLIEILDKEFYIKKIIITEGQDH